MRRKWLPVVCLALGLTLLAGWVQAGPKAVPRMSVEELNKILDDPELTVIDVRAGSDWKTSPDKIKGAVRQEPKGVGTWSAAYDKAKTIVLYCA
jgi:hypothetical protein